MLNQHLGTQWAQNKLNFSDGSKIIERGPDEPPTLGEGDL